MTPTDDQQLSGDKAAYAEVHKLREPTSRWDNAPGDIVIVKRGGKDVNVPL